MSYHVEAPRFGFKELPDRILVREDGAYGASKEHGEPIIDHWYVPEQDASQAALERRIDELCAEVERLKEREQNLVTLLRNDCNIEASWDGLRKFWYIDLTESGCLMRDRACKAEAENAKLIVKLNAEHIARQNVEIENAKLLRLLRALALCADDSADCDKCVMNGAAYSSVRQTFCDGMADELRDVGIEVGE